MTRFIAWILLTIAFATGSSFAQDDIDQKIEQGFAKLENTVSSTATTVFGAEVSQSWKAPSAFVTNRLVGTAVDYTLSKSGLKVSFKFPKQKIDNPATSTIRVKPIEVDCDFCPKCGDCDLLKGCDLICQGKRAACLTTASAAIASCEIVKQASKLADGAQIADIDFQDIELSASATSTGIGAHLDNSLNPTVEVQGFNANAQAAADLTVTFEDIPGIVLGCAPKIPYVVRIQPAIDLSVSSQAFEVPASLEKTISDGKMNFSLKIHELKPSVHINGNPFWDMVKANPVFTQTCLIPAAVIEWGGLVQLLFPITVDIPVKEKDLPIPLSDVPVPIAGESYSIRIVSTQTAIGVVADRVPGK